MKTLHKALEKSGLAREVIYREWKKSVQGISNKYQVEIATGHLSDTWQVNSGVGKTDFRTLRDDESNNALLELDKLDELVADSGVGPSNMERFKPNVSAYEQQAQDFLAKNGLSLRITLSDSKAASWSPSGHHYRVTLSRKGTSGRVSFDFWGSQADMQSGKDATPYDVLACISSDYSCPETFADFCGEYSIKALQTFRRADRFARKLRAFLTETEAQQLSEIN